MTNNHIQLRIYRMNLKEAGIDISSHFPKNVGIYLNDTWDYVITVCGGANETCPMFIGKVGDCPMWGDGGLHGWQVQKYGSTSADEK